MEIAERNVHRERRRLFWQRAYLQVLDHVVKFQPLDAEGTSRLAADHANEAVRRLDEQEADAPEATDDADRQPARPDTPASPYLGGRD